MNSQCKVVMTCPHCKATKAMLTIIGKHNKITCEDCGKLITSNISEEETTKLLYGNDSKLPNVVSPSECRHLYAVPYELEAGVLRYKDKACTPYIDWTSNVINANRLRVRRYYCFDCNKIFSVPSDASDE